MAPGKKCIICLGDSHFMYQEIIDNAFQIAWTPRASWGLTHVQAVLGEKNQSVSPKQLKKFKVSVLPFT